MTENKENKSIISVALNTSEKVAKNESMSKYFMTKKDEAYIVNNEPMLMKSFEKRATKFLDVVKAKNSNKLLTAKQINSVMIALLNDNRVLEVVKTI